MVAFLGLTPHTNSPIDRCRECWADSYLRTSFRALLLLLVPESLNPEHPPVHPYKKYTCAAQARHEKGNKKKEIKTQKYARGIKNGKNSSS